MISGYNAPEQGCWPGTKGTGINMNDQEHRNKKSHGYVQNIRKDKSAYPEYFIYCHFGEHQAQSGYDQERHCNIHCENIAEFL